MFKDPIVEEVRKVRDELAKKYNYDIDAMFAELQEKQKRHGKLLVNLKEKKRREKEMADR